MSDTTFEVSPDVEAAKPLEKVDYVGKLRIALRRPIEATWLPRNLLVACDPDHALLSAMKSAFYSHLPLRLSPDAIWITLARGLALHVNEHAEELRNRFVSHRGKEKLVVERPDFLPGEDNPWPEAFEEFSGQLAERTGGLTSLVEADFSTTGPVQRAVSHLMAMETFKSYFEYEMLCGCGIPAITLTGTSDDWRRLREKAQRFADYGLHEWIEALDPVLAQFELAKAGNADAAFWQSMFRYHSGSGPAVLTGWATVLFPYIKEGNERLCPNPYLKDWKTRLEIDDRQHWRDRWNEPQGPGIGAFPACFTSVPLKVFWGTRETDMRLVGGLLGVTQDEKTLAVEPECGWVVVYEEPVAPLSEFYRFREGGVDATASEEDAPSV
jgi:hypothetical protein